MKRTLSIDPFFFTHPMNGLLCVLLLLATLPFIGLYSALIVTFLTSIIGLLVLYKHSYFRLQLWSITLGSSVLILFTIVSLVCSSFWQLCGLSYQIILFMCYIPLSFISVVMLKNKGKGLSRMDELCEENLKCQLLITEHKRVNKRLLALSIVIVLSISPLLLRGAINTYCRMPSHQKDILSVLVVLPFVLLYLYEVIRLSMLKKELSKEEWIPLLSATNETIGRINKANVCNYKGEAFLPIVRVIVLYEDTIYLEGCSTSGYDTPLIRWLLEGAQTRDIARDMVASALGNPTNHSYHLMLSYNVSLPNSFKVHSSLYCLRLSDKNDFNLKNGKWWSIDSLCDEVNKSILNDLLKEELPYLRETNRLCKGIRG